MSREPRVSNGLVGALVLIVEPDAAARELLESVLTYCGAAVVLAASAREALDVLHEKPVDVVIVDVALPGEDPVALLHAAAARTGTGRQVPAIALGTRGGDLREQLLADGFRHYLPKPVDPWELCRLVASLARKA